MKPPDHQITRSTAPPRRATALLAARLRDCAWRDSILGDLDEEYAAIARRRSRFGANLWYWRQVVAVPRDRNSSRLNIPGPLGGSTMRGFMSELRLGVRSAFKQPGHTLLVVLALALGLGLNAAVYGMGDALLFRPFPIAGIDRLVVIGDKAPGAFDSLSQNASPANFLDWQRSIASGPIEKMIAWEYWDATLTGGSEPERVQAYRVSPGFFQGLGAPVTTGREFGDADLVAGQDRQVVLSRSLWQRRFGADPALVGRTVQMEGLAYTVVGIAADKFSFPQGSEAWVPLAFDADEARLRGNRYLTVIGRLRDGATLDDAAAHMGVIAARLKKDHPADNGQVETHVQTVAQGLGDPGVSNLIIVWQASAALVLLIACGNVASLLLARGATRAREMAVRLAIGASRWRLVRQLLLESFVLAMLAIPLSLGIAWWMLRVIKSYMPARIANFVLGWNQIDLDGRVILFTIAAAILTTAIFGLLPALQSSSLAMVDTLKQGGRGHVGGRLRLRKALVIAEIALALPLLVAAGMTALGTYRFINGPQGYDPAGLLTFRVSLPAAGYPTIAERAQFTDRVEQALRQTPGVQAAAGMNVIPSSSSGSSRTYAIEGDPPRDPNAAPQSADYRTVTPSYFETMRIPVLSGRTFSSLDTAASQQVAMVSESFARRHWAGQDPIGRQLVFTGAGTPAARTVVTIVGTAGDITHDWFAARNRPTVFRPAAQAIGTNMGFVARTAGDPAALAPSVRGALARVDRHQAMYYVMTQEEQVWERTVGPQYAAGMMAMFGGLALLLSVIGIYALIGYYVTQRRQEIGVRMALGAQPRDVVRLTVRQAGVMVAFGVGIGAVAAFLLGRVLESALFGIAQNDPRLLATFAAMLALSGLAAGYLPARRAALIDPMVAIRND